MGRIAKHRERGAVASDAGLIDRKLAGAWRKEQACEFTCGMSILLVWIGGLALGALLMDRFLDLPGYGRALLLLSCIAASVAAAWRYWRGLRRYNPVRIALRVEDRHRELNTLLVSAVEFSRTPPDPGASESLRRNVVSRAAADTLSVPFGEFVRTRSLRKWLIVLGGVALFYVALSALKPTLMHVFILRMLNPFAEAAYPTQTSLQLLTGDVVVKEGDSVTLEARAEGLIPARGTVYVKMGEAGAVAVVLQKVITAEDAENAENRTHQGNGTAVEPQARASSAFSARSAVKAVAVFRHTLPEVYQDFSYHFRAGDARSAHAKVSVIPSPRITRARVELRPPAYMGRPESRSESLTFRAPEGAAIHWTLDLDRPVANGVLLLEGVEPIRMDVRAGGKVVKATTTAHASRAYRFRWVEREHKFPYEGGRHFLQVTPDREPRVTLVYPKEDQKATLQGRLTISLRARDDHGIAAARLMYIVNEGKETAFPLDPVGGAANGAHRRERRERQDQGNGSSAGRKQLPSSAGSARSAVKAANVRSLDRTVKKELKRLVPKLKEGDIVTYAVEVTDAYPGTGGAHVSRSEARRVQILSEKDYLAYVARRRLSTLRLLRSAYRQERMASDKLKALRDRYDRSPRRPSGLGLLSDLRAERFRRSRSYQAQEALLEATRQALVQQRLRRLVSALDALKLDVRSNGLLDKNTEAEYETLKQRIRQVESGPVQGAAAALRLAADEDTDPAEGQAPSTARPALTGVAGNLGRAAVYVDKAAREIGSLMVRLGVDFAIEVFARELHEIVMKEESLRLATAALADRSEGRGVLPPAEVQALWPRQGELADWLTRLLRELKSVDDYHANALAVVRLSRVVGMLREAKVEGGLQAAAYDIRQKAFAKAIARQTAAMIALLKAEFRIRHGAELEALLRTKEAYARILSDHKALRLEIARWDDAKLVARKAGALGRERKLARDTALTIVPPQPEGSTGGGQFTLASTSAEQIDVDEAARAAADAMKKAASALSLRAAPAKRPPPPISKSAESVARPLLDEAQVQAEGALRRAIQGLEQRLQKIMHLTNVMRRLQEARRRLTRITQLRDQEQGLLDDTRESVDKKEESSYLASPQSQLGIEVKQFRAGLEKDNASRYPPNKYVQMICRPLARAETSMAKAVKPLKENRGAEAVPSETRAVRELGEAKEIAQQEVEALERISELLRLAGDLRRLAMYLAELEAEQRALREETERAGPAKEKLVPLAKPQATLGRAVGDVIAMLEGIAPARELGQVLRETQGVMGEAEKSLKAGLVSEMKATAVPQQKEAEKLLIRARKLALDLAEQYDYTAEWLAFLQQFQADAMDLLQRQIMLRLETQAAEVKAFPELAGEQDILRAEADTFAQLFPVGSEDYATAAREMASAITQLGAPDRKKALHHMVLAEEALRKALSQLLAAMEALEEVPMISLMAEVPDQANILLQALMLATEQRKLRYHTRASPPRLITRFAAPQSVLQRKAADLVWEADGSPLIEEASKEMTAATKSLKESVRAEAVRHQQLAEKALRRFILELALQLFELSEEPMEPSGMPSMPSVLPVVMTMESLHLFSKTAVEGDLEKGGRSEWRVLGLRERAALNENFARELPLEYRAILKGYYEKLAE